MWQKKKKKKRINESNPFYKSLKFSMTDTDVGLAQTDHSGSRNKKGTSWSLFKGDWPAADSNKSNPPKGSVFMLDLRILHNVQQLNRNPSGRCTICFKKNEGTKKKTTTLNAAKDNFASVINEFIALFKRTSLIINLISFFYN